MNPTLPNRAIALLLGLAVFVAAGTSQTPPAADAGAIGVSEAEITRSMGIDQRLGESLPREVPFKDETGRAVKLGDYLGKRPLVVVPIFYRCRTGCALILEGMMKTLTKATRGDILRVGRDFDVVVIGIHPKETPELAANRKKLIVQQYNQPGTENGWHLLTGDERSIRAATDALGFRFYYNAEKDLIRHPTASIQVSPEGRIVAYTIGNNFPTRVLQDNVALAARNEVGMKADQSFMFGCLMLDPATGRIRFVVENIVRAGCFLTVIVLGGSILRMALRERAQNRTNFERGGHPRGA